MMPPWLPAHLFLVQFSGVCEVLGGVGVLIPKTRRAAGIGLINSLGNLGGFLAPNMRDYFKATVGGNAGLYALAVGAVVGAILFALTGMFKKANKIEAGQLDEVDALTVTA